jgi:hypothetical protein
MYNMQTSVQPDMPMIIGIKPAYDITPFGKHIEVYNPKRFVSDFDLRNYGVKPVMRFGPDDDKKSNDNIATKIVKEVAYVVFDIATTIVENGCGW